MLVPIQQTSPGERGLDGASIACALQDVRSLNIVILKLSDLYNYYAIF